MYCQSISLTSFVGIDTLVERHSGMTKLEDLVRILDVVAYLVTDDPRRVDEPRQRQVALLIDRMRISRDVVEPAGHGQLA